MGHRFWVPLHYHRWIESLESVPWLSLLLLVCSQTITEHSTKAFKDLQ